MRQPSTCAGLQGLEEDAVAVHGFVGHHERLTIPCPGGSPALIGDLSFRSAERRYQKHAAVMDSLQPVVSNLPSVWRPGWHRLVELRRVGETLEFIAIDRFHPHVGSLGRI